MKQRQIVPDLGARLRLERLRLRISQQALAATGCVSVATQLAYEQGTRTPDVAYLVRIEPTGIDTWYVLHGVSHAQEALKRLDWDLLARVADAIQTWAKERGVRLTKEQWAAFAKMLYRSFGEHPAVPEQELKSAIRALAV